MNSLSRFFVTKKWPAEYPDRLQLYSRATPNGVKVSIMLEETGLPYEVHAVDFEAGDQRTAEFLSLNPNNKIPAIIDPHGPDGAPVALFESAAILIYLADKTDRFMPRDAGRYEAIQWLMFQAGGIAPMFGQLGFFHKFAGREYEDKRPLQRYVAESQRLLSALERHLMPRRWMMGEEYTVVDMSIFPWIRNLVDFYGAAELVEFERYPRVKDVLDSFVARPAVQRGLNIRPRS